ncbi:MAG: primosomal replication protein N [Burkholderiaceae bacterium]
MDNRVALTACLTEAQALRFTPGGVSALSVLLEHQSRQQEAGQERLVRAVVKAVAFGEVAEQLARLPVGSVLTLRGFLATPRNGKHPVIHIQEYQHD